ncbi:unnamed protein product, partial [Protopolystoma xenopodis]
KGVYFLLWLRFSSSESRDYLVGQAQLTWSRLRGLLLQTPKSVLSTSSLSGKVAEAVFELDLRMAGHEEETNGQLKLALSYNNQLMESVFDSLPAILSAAQLTEGPLLKPVDSEKHNIRMQIRLTRVTGLKAALRASSPLPGLDSRLGLVGHLRMHCLLIVPGTELAPSLGRLYMHFCAQPPSVEWDDKSLKHRRDHINMLFHSNPIWIMGQLSFTQSGHNGRRCHDFPESRF